MSLSGSKNRGRKSTPLNVVLERREQVGLMKQAGIKIRDIQRMINKMNAVKGWGQVSQRTIERDWESYRENLTVPEGETFYWEASRQVHLDQMEATIEKLSIYLKTKKSWAPFEYPHTLLALVKIQMRYAELRGWNYGKRKFNPVEAGMNEERFKSLRLKRNESRLNARREEFSQLQKEFLESIEHLNFIDEGFESVNENSNVGIKNRKPDF